MHVGLIRPSIFLHSNIPATNTVGGSTFFLLTLVLHIRLCMHARRSERGERISQRANEAMKHNSVCYVACASISVRLILSSTRAYERKRTRLEIWLCKIACCGHDICEQVRTELLDEMEKQQHLFLSLLGFCTLLFALLFQLFQVLLDTEGQAVK